MKELTRKTTYESNSLGLYPQTNLNIWATIRKHVVVNRKTTGQKDMHCWATYKSCRLGFIHKVIIGVKLSVVCSGNYYTFELVVDNTCKIQAFFCFRDQNDRSPLHLAALKGSAQCCEAILQKFEDCVNWTDKNKVTFFAFYLKVIINY